MPTKTKPEQTDTIPDNATADMEAAVDSALDEFEARNKPDADKFEAAAKPEDKIDLGKGDDPEGSEESEELENDLPSEEDEDTKPKDDVSPEAEEEDDDEEDGDIPDPDPIEDDLLEEAVKAGMSMKNARKFPDAESLRETIGILSGRSNESDADDGEESGGEASELESVLSDIPDLDPEEYDPDLVKVVSGLKNLVLNQNKEIQSLKDGRTGTWVESQINSLGDAAKTVRDDPGKKSALLKKYEVLNAGYKATGEKINEEAVFQEAASMVLGNDITAQKTKAKSDAARKRSKARISRTSGQNAQTPGGDDVEDIVAMVSDKFKIPK